jgi:hypothetical protein
MVDALFDGRGWCMVDALFDDTGCSIGWCMVDALFYGIV